MQLRCPDSFVNTLALYPELENRENSEGLLNFHYTVLDSQDSKLDHIDIKY